MKGHIVEPYWIDAVVMIQASNAYYPFHRVPKFWRFLARQLELGTIKSSKIVWQEVSAGTDELARWVVERREMGLCIAANQQVQAAFAKVSEYVYSKYKPHQAAEFLKGGDGWIIAHAMVSGGTVVTEESKRSKESKVKIPTVCKALDDVRCVNTFTMLEELKAGEF